MARIKTWEISNEFWELVEPLIPKDLRNKNKSYKRKSGGGRKPRYSDRVYFAGIVYVLRTGIIWNAFPRGAFQSLGSSALHSKFQQWADAGYVGKSKLVIEHGFIPHIRSRGEEKKQIEKGSNFKARRWIVEVSHSWFNRFRKLIPRYEKTTASYEALTRLAAAMIILNKVLRISS